VQVAGASALRIETPALLAAIQQSETLRMTLLRYVQTVLVQSAQSTATIALGDLAARLSRWLVMCHDRVEGDRIELTHEFMGMMIAANGRVSYWGRNPLRGARKADRQLTPNS
jgi:CRP-like cAMP-binding protein